MSVTPQKGCPTLPEAAEEAGTGLFAGVTSYHWLVVILASCGWLFDCMGGRIFVLAR